MRSSTTREEKILFSNTARNSEVQTHFFFKSCLFWHCPLNFVSFFLSSCFMLRFRFAASKSMFFLKIFFPALFHILPSIIERCYPQKCSDIDTNSLSINLECSEISFVQLLSIVFFPKTFSSSESDVRCIIYFMH